LSRSRSESEVPSQRVAFELRSEYETAEKTAELLKFTVKALPQREQDSRQALQAIKAIVRLSALLTSFLDVLHLDEEYWRSMAES